MHLGFWSGNLFLIAPFPDLCLLVPFSTQDILKEEIDHFRSIKEGPTKRCFPFKIFLKKKIDHFRSIKEGPTKRCFPFKIFLKKKSVILGL